MIIIGIEHLDDVARQVLLLYCLLVITLVERIQTENIDGLRIPDTEGVYDAVSVAYYGRS